MLASREILGVLHPGDHGSTFGGNPLACAVARAALRVIVDERLPERSATLGTLFLDRLRQIPEMFETPVVFLTTSALASDVIEAKHSSACSYIVKPETYDELKARLDKVITRVVSGGSR